MQIHVAINGNRQPPQSEEQLRAKITAGDIPADALCWHEGWNDWRPVSQAYPELFAGGVAVPPPVPAAPADAEAIRREHIKHEASVRSIGSLYLLGTGLLTFAAIAGLLTLSNAPADSETEGVSVAVSVLLLVFAALYFQVGRWLRALNPKGKTPATILAIIGLLGFPIGTLINAYILYLLNSKKGAVVFSAEYAAVRAATPHIRYKTSIIVWIFLGLLLALFAAALIIPAFAR